MDRQRSFGGAGQVDEAAVDLRHEHPAHLAQDVQSPLEHRDLDVAAQDAAKLRSEMLAR